MTQHLVYIWKRQYDKNPRATVIVTIVFAILIAVFGPYLDEKNKAARESKRQESLSYENQISEMNKMEASLRNLTDFVQAQKTKLKESEDIVAQLRAEQARIKPVVEADRLAIQAVFDLQDERNRGNLWTERLIGFGLGVVASILASFIWSIIGYVISTRFK